jgi:hypothetical protein
MRTLAPGLSPTSSAANGSVCTCAVYIYMCASLHMHTTMLCDIHTCAYTGAGACLCMHMYVSMCARLCVGGVPIETLLSLVPPPLASLLCGTWAGGTGLEDLEGPCSGLESTQCPLAGNGCPGTPQS